MKNSLPTEIDSYSRFINYALITIIIGLPVVIVFNLYPEQTPILEAITISAIHSLLTYLGYRLGRGKLQENFNKNIKKILLGTILGILIIPLPTIIIGIYTIYFSGNIKPL